MRTRNFFLTCFALVACLSSLNAAPFDTGLIQWTQPGGVTFVGREWGDEFFHWAETQDGYRYVMGSSSWYCYATLDRNGEFAPTSYRVGIDLPPSNSYKLERSPARITAINDEIAQFRIGVQTSAGWFAQRQQAANAIGQPVTIRLGVILADFPNAPHFNPNTPSRTGGYLRADFDSIWG